VTNIIDFIDTNALSSICKAHLDLLFAGQQVRGVNGLARESREPRNALLDQQADGLAEAKQANVLLIPHIHKVPTIYT
jgi:hypothetical protein